MQGFPGDTVVKNLPAVQETQEKWVRSLGLKGSLEEEITTHSSCLKNSTDRGAWWATVHAVHGAAKRRIWLSMYTRPCTCCSFLLTAFSSCHAGRVLLIFYTSTQMWPSHHWTLCFQWHHYFYWFGISDDLVIWVSTMPLLEDLLFIYICLYSCYAWFWILEVSLSSLAICFPSSLPVTLSPLGFW